MEETPVEEPVVEKQPVEENEPVEEIKSPEKAEENDKPKPAKTTKKPAKKPAKKPVENVETPKVDEPAPVEEEPTTVFAKIPGRFIVKSNKGYVVSKTEFSNVKSQARVFDDFNDARRYKAMFGGKVIKL